jgi:hypothetical protein
MEVIPPGGNLKEVETTEDRPQQHVFENSKKIESHRAAAAHLEAAVIHHREAAKHYAVGDYEKAHQSAFYAQGHHTMAGDYMKEGSFMS